MAGHGKSWVWAQLEQGMAFPSSSGTICKCTVSDEHLEPREASGVVRYWVPLPWEHLIPAS